MSSRSNTFYGGEENNWFPKYGGNNLKPKNGVNFSIKINISCFLEIKKNSRQQWDNNLSSELKIHQAIYRILWKQTEVDNFRGMMIDWQFEVLPKIEGCQFLKNI